MNHYNCTKTGPIRTSSGKIIAFVNNEADREGVLLELNSIATERDLLAESLDKAREELAAYRASNSIRGDNRAGTCEDRDAYQASSSIRGDNRDFWKARAERAEAALKRILAKPDGCPWCDSGVLRNPKKSHSDDCGFKLARETLAATGTPTATAITDIATERERQKTGEGWTEAHDDAHQRGELASGAVTYAATHLCRVHFKPERVQAEIIETMANHWPWDEEHFKPTTSRRDLVKAGALIVAEIERIDRAAAKEGSAS